MDRDTLDRSVVAFMPFDKWSDAVYDAIKREIARSYRWARMIEAKFVSDNSGWEFAIYLPVVLPIRGVR